MLKWVLNILLKQSCLSQCGGFRRIPLVSHSQPYRQSFLLTVCCKINCSAVFERFLKCAVLASFSANCTLIIPDSVMTWLIWWLITARTVLLTKFSKNTTAVYSATHCKVVGARGTSTWQVIGCLALDFASTPSATSFAKSGFKETLCLTRLGTYRLFLMPRITYPGHQGNCQIISNVCCA
jgi:hypothetical protein